MGQMRNISKIILRESVIELTSATPISLSFLTPCLGLCWVLIVRSVGCQHLVSYNNANNRERWAEISELCLGSKKYERMPQFEKNLLLHFIILTVISPLLPDISKEKSSCSSSPCGIRAQCHNFSSGSFICKCDRNGDYPFGTNNIV